MSNKTKRIFQKPKFWILSALLVATIGAATAGIIVIVNKKTSTTKVNDKNNEAESLQRIKKVLENKVIRINKDVDTSDNTKRLIALKQIFKAQDYGLSDVDIQYIKALRGNFIQNNKEQSMVLIVILKHSNLNVTISIKVIQDQPLKNNDVDNAIQALQNNDLTFNNKAINLNNEINKLAILDIIKATIRINALTADQKALIVVGDIVLDTATDGTLKITIQNHGLDKKLTITGFETLTSRQKKLDKKTVETAIQALADNNSLVFATKQTALNSEIQKDQVVNAIKAISAINALSANQKALIIEKDIVLDTATDGTLKITIQNHGLDKVLTITGFETKSERKVREDKVVVETAIQALAENNGLTFASKQTTLNTEITTKDVVDAIKIVSTINTLTNDQKALIVVGNITLDTKTDGTLKITIQNHGLDKVLTITGFETKAEKKIREDKAVVEKAIQNLANNSLTFTSKQTTLNTEIQKDQVVNAIKAINTINTLTNDQKALIVVGDITLDTKTDGTLKITIQNHGLDKVLTITGFETKAEKKVREDKAVVEKAIQNLANNSLTFTSKQTTLNTEIQKDQVVNAIKAINTINALTADQKALIVVGDIVLNTTTDGTLKITIQNHGLDKLLTITGFETKAEKKVRENKVAVETAIQALAENNGLTFTSKQTTLNTEIQKDQVVNAIKAVNTINALTADQKALIVVGNIVLDTATDGTLKITIQNHGLDKLLTITGFETKAEKKVREDKVAVETAIQALAENNGLTFTSKQTTLNTEIQKDQVVNAIKAINTINALTADQKALIVVGDITLDTKTDGTLKITIQNHGLDKLLTITGFETKAEKKVREDKAVVEKAIQNLANNSLTFASKGTTLNTEITTKNVVDAIKIVSTINTLTADQKALIVVGDITLDTKTDGTLKITIQNHGLDKVLTITGFETKAEKKVREDKAVVEKAIQNLANNSLTFTSKQTTLNTEIQKDQVVNAIKAISTINALTADQKALIVVGDIVLNTTTDGTLKIIIQNHGSDKAFTITNFRKKEDIIKYFINYFKDSNNLKIEVSPTSKDYLDTKAKKLAIAKSVNIKNNNYKIDYSMFIINDPTKNQFPLKGDAPKVLILTINGNDFELKINQSKLKQINNEEIKKHIQLKNGSKLINKLGLKLINPSFITGIGFSKYGEISFEKIGKIEHSDIEGTIKIKVSLLFNGKKIGSERTIIYSGLPKSKGIDDKDLKDIENLELSKGNYDTYNRQFILNIWVRKNNGDISSKSIYNTKLRELYVDDVKKWPKDLSGIDWTGVKGLTSNNTPFVSEWNKLFSLSRIKKSILNGVDLSKIINWDVKILNFDEEDLKNISFEGAKYKITWENLNTNNNNSLEAKKIWNKINIDMLTFKLKKVGLNGQYSTLNNTFENDNKKTKSKIFQDMITQYFLSSDEKNAITQVKNIDEWFVIDKSKKEARIKIKISFAFKDKINSSIFVDKEIDFTISIK